MNKIEIGKKYRTRDGRPARVICVDAKGTQPVVALVANDGREKVISTDLAGECCNNYDLDLIEVGPYGDFKIDEPVMVRNHHDIHNLWFKRFFAGEISGLPYTWDFGATSWSSDNGHKSSWDECRRPTPEELGGVN